MSLRGTRDDPYARLYRRREEQRRQRRRKRALGLIALLALVIGGYVAVVALDEGAITGVRAEATQPTQSRSGARESRVTSGTALTLTASRSRPATHRSTALLTEADEASFRNLERDLGGRSGLAVSAIGLGQPVRDMGTLREDVAWSTIKVPLAVAIETRAAGQLSASEQSLLARAITASDNAAAEELWSSLGAPSEAATAVQGILTSTGDTATRVETRVLRPGFTSFGQTRWSLAAQQRFIAGLPCLPEAAPVLSLMQQVIPDQRWGLGAIGVAAQFKGGWGPDLDGGYLVRQMGIVRLENGRLVAASMATLPPDGRFETGTANITQIAEWLIAHVDSRRVSPASCHA
jgi:hypothetical protein